MAKITAGIPPLLLYGLVALIGTSASTAIDVTVQDLGLQAGNLRIGTGEIEMNGRHLQADACSNGLPGYEASNVCCPLSCGTCGGDGCSQLGEGCCTSDVKDSGDLCSETMAAPCNIDGDVVVDDQTCSNGLPGYEASDVCCPLSCGTCGGRGCSQLGEGCCTSDVKDSGDLCSETMAAPCNIDDDVVVDGQTCSNGVPGYEASNVCCPLSCGTCGGSGCSQLGEGCCTSDVKDSGDLCSETMAAPCNIDEDVVVDVNLCLNPSDGNTRCQLSGSGQLDLRDCQISDADVDQLELCFEAVGKENISYLRLDDNDFTTLPAGIFEGFTELQELYLNDNNDLATLPAEVFEGLSKLQALSLHNNDLTALPAGIFEGLTALKSLLLFGNGLTTLSAGIFEDLTALETLSLSRNDLTTLPAGIFEGLTNLDFLSCFSNDLTVLPAAIFEGLTALEDLYLYDNGFTTLPAGIFEGLTALQWLQLTDNDLTTLPAGIFDGLTGLEFLYLSYNGLTTLPADIFEDLTALTRLRLENNDLTTLPAGIFDGLMELQELDLEGNPLECLPTSSASSILADLGDECGCFITGEPVCRENQQCTPGSEGYACA
eukprot:g11261.t2